MTDEFIERLWSLNLTSRANIIRRGDGLLVVEIERLVPGDHVHGEPDYWSRVSGAIVIADALDRARELAVERLKSIESPTSEV
jgi:hypothetical protein